MKWTTNIQNCNEQEKNNHSIKIFCHIKFKLWKDNRKCKINKYLMINLLLSQMIFDEKISFANYLKLHTFT